MEWEASKGLKKFSGGGWWWSEIKYSPHPFIRPRKAIRVWDRQGTGKGWDGKYWGA